MIPMPTSEFRLRADADRFARAATAGGNRPVASLDDPPTTASGSELTNPSPASSAPHLVPTTSPSSIDRDKPQIRVLVRSRDVRNSVPPPERDRHTATRISPCASALKPSSGATTRNGSPSSDAHAGRNGHGFAGRCLARSTATRCLPSRLGRRRPSASPDTSPRGPERGAGGSWGVAEVRIRSESSLDGPNGPRAAR